MHKVSSGYNDSLSFNLHSLNYVTGFMQSYGKSIATCHSPKIYIFRDYARQLKYNNANFPSNLYCKQKVLSLMGLYAENPKKVHTLHRGPWFTRADSRFAPSQWETSLQSNVVSHWLATNLKSAMFMESVFMGFHHNGILLPFKFFALQSCMLSIQRGQIQHHWVLI